MQPVLTRVCRQIRKESLAIFYEENVFITYRGSDEWCDHGTWTISWLQSIGSEHRNKLKHLYIDFWGEIVLTGLFNAFREDMTVKAMEPAKELHIMLCDANAKFSEHGKILHVTFG